MGFRDLGYNLPIIFLRSSKVEKNMIFEKCNSIKKLESLKNFEHLTCKIYLTFSREKSLIIIHILAG